MEKKFMALKGQPIHKGHCYLMRTLFEESSKSDLLIIGIVNLYPLEKMDLSKNRKSENFLIEKNPLTYFERVLLIRNYLTSIHNLYPHISLSNVILTPYFIPTIFSKDKMYNYLDIKSNSIEYISDKDDFEKGKAKELNEIGVKVRFVQALKDKNNEYYSADKIRDDICKGVIQRDDFDEVIYRKMLDLGLFEKMKHRISEHTTIY